MPFRFSDLMIHVLPSAEENFAGFGRNKYANPWCLWPISVVDGCQNIFTLADVLRPIPYSVDELAVLKRHLQQTLAQIEAQEKIMKEMMRPQTVAEAQELEEKMVRALEELRSQKEELQKNATEGQR